MPILGKIVKHVDFGSNCYKISIFGQNVWKAYFAPKLYQMFTLERYFLKCRFWIKKNVEFRYILSKISILGQNCRNYRFWVIIFKLIGFMPKLLKTSILRQKGRNCRFWAKIYKNIVFEIKMTKRSILGQNGRQWQFWAYFLMDNIRTMVLIMAHTYICRKQRIL